MYERGSTNAIAAEAPSGLSARVESLQKHAAVLVGQIEGLEAFFFGSRDPKASGSAPAAVPNGRIEELAALDERLDEISSRLHSIINALG